MTNKKTSNICFIAPSTCLAKHDAAALNRTAKLLKKSLGAEETYLSPFLFSCDGQIDHVTAPADQRSEEFKNAIREYDLVVSVAGGTGAEDLAFKIDKKDFRVIRERRPLLIGFSDFTFLLNEIYYSCRTPLVYFPALKLNKGNVRKMIALVSGEEVQYQGSRWLTRPPARRLSGVPIGGNLSTFVNYLNREKPPQLNWKRHILFFEDIQVDVEDLHRMFAALRRHKIFRRIRGIVIGSLSHHGKNSNYQRTQKESLKFIQTYLADIIQRRKKQGFPLPILSVSNFGHDITRDLMIVPMGGYVTISKNKKITFRMRKNHKKA